MGKSELQFITVKDVPNLIAVDESAVRWWIWSNVDGFNDQCVTRRGRRIFIDRAELLRWFDAGRPASAR